MKIKPKGIRNSTLRGDHYGKRRVIVSALLSSISVSSWILGSMSRALNSLGAKYSKYPRSLVRAARTAFGQSAETASVTFICVLARKWQPDALRKAIFVVIIPVNMNFASGHVSKHAAVFLNLSTLPPLIQSEYEASDNLQENLHICTSRDARESASRKEEERDTHTHTHIYIYIIYAALEIRQASDPRSGEFGHFWDSPGEKQRL